MDGKHRHNSLDHNILCSNARCGCGNCSVFFLQNIRECYCCTELEGCGQSLETDLVLNLTASIDKQVIDFFLNDIN